MTREGFWENNQQEVQEVNQKLTRAKEKIARFEGLKENIEEQELLLELYEEERMRSF